MRRKSEEKKPEVLWKGKYIAIVKYPGSSYYGGTLSGTLYNPMELYWVGNAWVGMTWYAIPDGLRGRLWEGGQGQRLTKAILAELIAQMTTKDATFLEDRKAAERAKTSTLKRENKLNALHERVQQAEKELLKTALHFTDVGGPTLTELNQAANKYRAAVGALRTAGGVLDYPEDG